MDGVTAIAQILRMEGVDFIGCVPYQPLLEAAAIAAYSERITDPQEIVPALQRGLAAVDGGTATVLEFITAEEGEYSKFAFR
jgi:hypothetical protein